MRTGVYGGTFNPIHSGHIHILREFIKRLDLKRVLLIPTGQPPHKRAHDLADSADRVRMCELAAKELKDSAVRVSTIEIERGGKSYTFETLRELSRLYPEDELYFLMGEDMFLSFETWRKPEVISSLAYLCASPRSDDGLQALLEHKKTLESRFGARCFVEAIPYFKVSSTQVRQLAVRGESLSGLVPAEVEEYIREHGVYRGKEQ